MRINQIFGVITILLSQVVTHGQDRSLTEYLELKRPVPFIKSDLAGSAEETGSGIITGVRDNRLFILTAAHVVEYGYEGGNIEVELFNNNSVIPAKLEEYDDDANSDIAIISIPLPSSYMGIHSFKLADGLPSRGTKVVIVGHPLTVLWDINEHATIKSVSRTTATFSLPHDQVKRGNSGGPVLDYRGQLLGIILETGGVETICMKSSEIMRFLRSWNIPTGCMTGTGIFGLTPPPPSGMVYVPGTERQGFQMGDVRNLAQVNARPVHRVSLKPFFMGKTEVTVAEFSEFIEATNYTTTADQIGTSKVAQRVAWTDTEGINWNHTADAKLINNPQSYTHPVVHISWYDAIEYCNWKSSLENLVPAYNINKRVQDPNNESSRLEDPIRWKVTFNPYADGYRLPTEAEREYAEKDAGRNIRFAWGDNPNGPAKGNVADYSLRTYLETPLFNFNDRYPFTSPVDAFPTQGTLGLFDMAGNVNEWCWDWYGEDYYSTFDGNNPKGPISGKLRVVRGSSWIFSPQQSYSGWRQGGASPAHRDGNLGFRLVRNIE